MNLSSPESETNFVLSMPGVPAEVIDRYSLPVDTSGDRWFVNDPAARLWIDWTKVTGLERDLLHAFKLYVCSRLETASPREAHNGFREIKNCFALLPSPLTDCESFGRGVFELLRHQLREKQQEYRLHRVRAFYLWMADMDLPGVSQDLAFAVSRWRIPGNIKGEAVMSLDLESGPLSDDEYFALLRAVRAEAEQSKALAAVMLGLELGCNPKNLLLLEERDLHRLRNPKTEEVVFQLNVPRIKKRQAWRDTKRRSISSELGTLLTSLIVENQERHGGPDPKRPILCRETKSPGLVGTPLEKRFSLHHTTEDFGRFVQGFAARKGIVSPRTGQPLLLTPRRLRYTFATRMAIQGTPPRVLAELLDHTDLQHVMVYINSRSSVVQRLDQALNDKVEPIYRRFTGTIVESESAATPSNSPAARILGQTQVLPSLGGIGTCGRMSLCNLYPPYSCYVCAHFQAWKDAPHDKMLEDVLAYQKSLQEQAHGPSDRIQHQLDEIIGAIREVAAMKAASNGE